MSAVFKITGLCLVTFILFTSSCKKCMHCTSAVKTSGVIVDTYPEICGKKKSLDSQELTYRFSLPDSLELTCPRD